MSRFYVGQRVRIVRILHGYPKQWVGREGVIAEVDTRYGETCFGLDIAPVWEDEAYVYGFGPSELEPIQPEGHQPSEFTTLADLLDSLQVGA